MLRLDIPSYVNINVHERLITKEPHLDEERCQ